MENKNYCIKSIFTDKCSYRITAEFLGKLLTQCGEAGKEPMLILSIPKNDTEYYELKCGIEVKKL